MQLKQIYKIADELAPKRLSDEACQTYGYYDNSGVLLDAGEDITGVQFSLDFSYEVIEKAIENGANLIITHHPAIYGGVGDTITQDTLLGKKLIQCLKKGISVISMHLNLDFAVGGIDESLMNGICRVCEKTTGTGMSLTIMNPLSNGGYGRAYEVEKISLIDLAEKVKREFHSDKVLYFGETDKIITKVASFCGAGADENAVRFAKERDVDVIVSSDFKHHVITTALEENISVLSLTHYASEVYGFNEYYKKISQRIEIPCYFYTDERL